MDQQVEPKRRSSQARNHSELKEGFEHAGWHVVGSNEEVDKTIARYGSPGVGGLNAAQLARALGDGAFELQKLAPQQESSFIEDFVNGLPLVLLAKALF